MYKMLFICFLVILNACSRQEAIERMPEYWARADMDSIAVYDFEHFKAFLEPPNDSIYILNFWATWCQPCVEELPEFVELKNRISEKAINLIFVSLDFERHLEQKLLPFLEKNELPGEKIVLKQDGMNDWIGKIQPQWDGSLPMTLIYTNTKEAVIFGQTDTDALLDILNHQF